MRHERDPVEAGRCGSGHGLYRYLLRAPPDRIRACPPHDLLQPGVRRRWRGLEFIAYDTGDVNVQRENPFLSYAEMFRVVTRPLDLYRRRHGGRPPTRVMIHKSTEFKEAEIEGCFEALKLIEAVDLIQIVEDNGWQAARRELSHKDREKSQADGYPVKRGTSLGLSGKDALLWMHGAVDGFGPRPYFQGGKGTRRPLRLVRQAGHGTWHRESRARAIENELEQ